MSKPVAALVSAYILDTVEAYVFDQPPPSYLREFFNALEVPDDAEVDPLQIAVARIVLRQVEKKLPQSLTIDPDGLYLPQWLTTDSSGKASWGRARTKRLRTTEPLTFKPQALFGINWADSAPGVSWPETYHATHIPGFDYYIITASRDSAEVWGCSDHAIGSFPAKTPIEEGACEIITDYWSRQARDWCQDRWAYFLKDGLFKCEVAYQWAEQVWGVEVELDDDWRPGERA